MEIFLNALRALWAVFKAQGASKLQASCLRGSSRSKR